MSRVDLVVPDLGNFNDVPVVDVLVNVGDNIEVDAPLVTLETDKASMDVPATAAGRIAEVLLKRGDKVSKGSVIARLENNSQAGAPAGEAAASAAPAAAAGGSAPAAKSPPAPAPSPPAAKPESEGDTVRMPMPNLTKPPQGQVDFNRSTQLLVLGSGPGGYTAAFRAADLGMQVMLVERWPDAGRRMSQCRMHSLQGAAARCKGHRGSRGDGLPRHRLRRAGNRPREAARLEGLGRQEADRRRAYAGEAAQGRGHSGRGPLRERERARGDGQQRLGAHPLRAVHHRGRLRGDPAAGPARGSADHGLDRRARAARVLGRPAGDRRGNHRAGDGLCL